MILKLFIVWRLGLFAATYIGSLIFPLIPNGGLGAIGPNKQFNFWASWAQWDGGHYYTIATSGYIEPNKFAFFPLYPLLVKVLSFFLFGHTLLAGLIISNVAFILFLYILKNVVETQFGKKAAINTVITYLVFPTTFFAVSYYSESLFLLLVALALKLIQKKKIYLAAITVALTSLTRLIGVFLIIPIIFYVFKNLKKQTKKSLLQIVAIPLSLAGIVSYCIFLYLRFGDPFYFSTVQSSWHRALTNPIATVYSYFTVNPFHKPFNDYLDLFLTLFFSIFLAFGVKKIPLAWSMFGFISVLIPASTGTLTSMPRYLLAAFPAFILIGLYLEGKTYFKVIIWFLMLSLQIVLAMMFVNGYWIA